MPGEKREPTAKAIRARRQFAVVAAVTGAALTAWLCDKVLAGPGPFSERIRPGVGVLLVALVTVLTVIRAVRGESLAFCSLPIFVVLLTVFTVSLVDMALEGVAAGGILLVGASAVGLVVTARAMVHG